MTAARVTWGAICLSNSTHFSSEAVFELGKAGDVAAGPSQAFDEARADRFDDLHEHDRDCAGCLLDDLWRRFTPKCGDYGDLSVY